MRLHTKRVRALELLLKLGIELHSERDFQKLLERIWEELTHVLEAERSSLFLVEDKTRELYSVIAQQAGEIRFPWGTGIAGKVAEQGVSLLIPDAYKAPEFNPEIDGKTGFRTRSILTVPLKNQRGEVIGVAQVLNRLDGEPFDEEDGLLLEALASMASVAIETIQLYEEQKSAAEAVISALMMALEMRDHQGRWHSREVRAYSRALAEAMELPEEEVRLIEWAAALHDIGKIAVPDWILVRSSPPSNSEEWAQYQAHALHTKELVETMAFSGELAGVAAISPYHHKRFKGGGFPPGPPDGKDVPLGARIIGVADALWVGFSNRWGRTPMSTEDTLRWIRQRAGSDFDMEVVGALFQIAPNLEEIRRAARTVARESKGNG